MIPQHLLLLLSGGAALIDLLSGEGAFNSATGWTILASPPWTISGGVASYDDTSSNNISHDLSTAIAAGNTIRIVFTIASAGTAQIAFRNQISQDIIALTGYAAGQHTLEVASPVAATGLIIRGSTLGVAFDIDDVAVYIIG